MGDPKKIRKKYEGPRHPWQGQRIEEEKKILKDYGLMKKKEIWKMQSVIKRAKDQAKRVIVDTTEQGKREREQLLKRLARLNLLKSNNIDDVLNLDLKDVLERRLQTLVYRRGLAKSINQARQFIIHRHVIVDGKLINSPSYLVGAEEENKISFKSNSSLNSPEHPERMVKEVKPVEHIKKE